MSDYADYRYLDVTVNDGIAQILIDRPGRLNACGLDDHREFCRILRDIGNDDAVRAAVVTGAGRAFSVGGDLELLEQVLDQRSEAAEQLFTDARDLVLAHVELDKPIVAAINGHAMGSGAAFALFCDLIVAERQAVIADGHVRAALAAGDGGTVIWPLTVGLTKAKQYLLTGDGITATEAERLGLVSEVVDQGQGLARATRIAERMAAGPQRAIRYTKRALNQWLRMAVATSFDYSLALEARTMGSPEAQQAVRDLVQRKGPAIPEDT